MMLKSGCRGTAYTSDSYYSLSATFVLVTRELRAISELRNIHDDVIVYFYYLIEQVLREKCKQSGMLENEAERLERYILKKIMQKYHLPRVTRSLGFGRPILEPIITPWIDAAMLSKFAHLGGGPEVFWSERKAESAEYHHFPEQCLDRLERGLENEVAFSRDLLDHHRCGGGHFKGSGKGGYPGLSRMDVEREGRGRRNFPQFYDSGSRVEPYRGTYDWNILSLKKGCFFLTLKCQNCLI